MTNPISLDPAEVVQNTPAIVEEVPPSTRESPNPGEDPIEIPGYNRITLALDSLPAELKSEDGQALLTGAVLAMLWQMLHSLQIRTVSGTALVTGVLLPDTTHDFPVTWDYEPSRVPTGGDVSFPRTDILGGIWAGQLNPYILPGSETLTGATLRVEALGTVVATPPHELPVEVKGFYLYTPPFGTE